MAITCIKCSIPNLTNIKKEMLDFEYNGFQWWMQFGIDKGILSIYKAAKGWTFKKDKIKYKSYPLNLQHKHLHFRERNTKLCKYWIKIPISKKKGIGLWLPVHPHTKMQNWKYLKDSVLIKNKTGNYELRLIFDIPTQKLIPKNILSIDLGEKVIATVCGSNGYKRFFGRNIRGIRRHYAFLRKILGRKKLMYVIKKIKNKEHNKVRTELHTISKQIVNEAVKSNAIIVVGKLKGIRNKKRSKKLNRIIFNMPYFTLTSMIKYKAEQLGIQVFEVNEAYTSRTCHKCGFQHKTNRKTQGLFICKNCSLEYNTDLNASINIKNRAIEQDLLAGAITEALKPIAII